MKVSIITVCFNSVNTLEETLNSVLGQNYPDIEYILVDGGSTDGSLDIIKKYSGRLYRYISEPDQGIYDAMNKGIQIATGDIIAVLNSDDVYFDTATVGSMAEFMQQNHLDAAYGDLVYIDGGKNDRVTRFWKAGEYKKGAFRKGWVIPHPTFFCRRAVFERYGYYNGDFRIAADFELMLRFVEKHGILIGYLSQIIVKMRNGGRANVVSGMIRGNWEILKSFHINGFRLSPWFFVLKPASKIVQLFIRPNDKTLKSNL